MSTTENKTTITHDDRLAITRQLQGMPYGGLIMHRMPRVAADDGKFVEQLVDVLSALSIELAKIAQQHNKLAAALHELQSQRDAVRSFLGIEQISDDLGMIQATTQQELRTIADAVAGD